MWPFSPRKPRAANHTSRRPSSFRPRLEVLEDRCLLNAGTLDPTFGNGAGYVTTSLSSGDNVAYSALIQPDGKIIATGLAFGPSGPNGTPSQPALVRYNADGSLDTSFGNGGEVLVPTNLNTGYQPMATLYPTTGTANDGKIVLADFTNSISVARYNPNGTLDTSFGDKGIATANFVSNGGSRGSASAVIQPDGKILAAGTGNDSQTLQIARFNADGSLDTTFGQGGLVTTALPGTDRTVGASNQTILLQPNGGLIVTTGASGSSSHFDLIGYNADGSLNTSFGTGGFVQTPPTIGGDITHGEAALYPTTGSVNDGKIVMTGFGTAPDGRREWMVKRYNANGTLDSTFGQGGSVFTSTGPQEGESSGVAIQPDGKLVVTGLNSKFVIRYNADGSLDSTFGTGGIVTTPIYAGYGSLALQPNGDIVVAGDVINGGKSNLAVARFLGDTTMAVTGFPTQTTAGTPGSFTVTALNSSGGTNTGYTGTVHFTSSDPQAGLPADYTFTAADQGVHTFTATLKTVGIQSITAADATDGFFGADTGITVNPAAASTLAVTGYSPLTNVGVAGNFTVTARDAYGNKATGYTGTVHFTSSDPLAGLPADYTFSVADNGIHTFSATLNTLGTQSLTATDTATGSFTGSQTGITVNPASLPATSLSVTGFPSTTTAGTAGTLTVTALDANGHVASGYRGTVHFASSDGQAGLPLDYTFTGVDQGVHTFSVILKTAGAQSLTATDMATGSITGRETGIIVRPGVANTLRISAPSSVSSGKAFSLTVTALDLYGNVDTGFSDSVIFSLSNPDGKAVLPPVYTFRASDAGVHTFINKTTLRARGTQTLSVTDIQAGVGGSVTIDVT